jgi:hypothetical protein
MEFWLYDHSSNTRKTIQVDTPASINVPVAILINANTASAAEVVAGALQARNRAVLVGANSFGKGSVQESLTLANGSSIEITVGRLRTPLGKFIEGKGIKPDLVATETESLPKAIELIKGLSDIFSDTAIRQPTSGSGECAAPRLLQYAFNMGYRPITMAEFWWGANSKDEMRQHKAFYPACRGKCQPILSHMLEGIEIEEHSLIEETSKIDDPKIIFE